MPLRIPTCCLLLALGLALPATAQGVATSAGGETFTYEFFRPGRATMTIYIWGSVARPGIWRVEPEVDLIELLSAARVPTLREDEQYNERLWLVIYRGEQSQRRQIYRKLMEDLLEEGATYPNLQGGDILELEVERQRRISFRTILQLVGTGTTLVLLLFRLGILDR